MNIDSNISIFSLCCDTQQYLETSVTAIASC